MKQKRFLCWDDKLIAENCGVVIQAHKPVKRNVALVCDGEWEGVHNGYGSVICVDGVYRLYYRADASRHQMDQTMSRGKGTICVAESRDGGITFRKPRIGKYEYNGSKYNNIIFMKEENIDNFSVFYDTNPACPADERFKALTSVHKGHGIAGLVYYASADGYDFREMYEIPVQGTFDSYNTVHWDEARGCYFLYYRAFHSKAGADQLNWRGMRPDDIRDIRVATSTDFKAWTEHGRIRFEEGQTDYPLYTNQITPYRRATDVMIGFPVRYNDRVAEKRNFHFMPLGDRHERVTELFGREGTAVTDCVVMTSEDGFLFNRRDEAFLTPGVEDRNNWWYGNCYMTYGLIETEAEEEGAPNEISFYASENYRIKSANFRRFTVRLDGFYSWYAPYRGGELLTAPITVTSDTLRVNFSTSAMGGMTVSLCDEDGTALAGYQSYTLFGDSVDRPVEFERELADLVGRQVRLRITLSDAHLYSFVFG